MSFIFGWRQQPAMNKMAGDTFKEFRSKAEQHREWEVFFFFSFGSKNVLLLRQFTVFHSKTYIFLVSHCANTCNSLSYNMAKYRKMLSGFSTNGGSEREREKLTGKKQCSCASSKTLINRHTHTTVYNCGWSIEFLSRHISFQKLHIVLFWWLKTSCFRWKQMRVLVFFPYMNED